MATFSILELSWNHMESFLFWLILTFIIYTVLSCCPMIFNYLTKEVAAEDFKIHAGKLSSASNEVE